MEDRLYIDKKRQAEIRSIKDKGYLEFDNQKDVFMCAMALGADVFSGKSLQNSREGFFNDRDLNEADKAIMRSLVREYLSDIEDLSDSDKVYHMAEGMADKGFTVMLESMDSVTTDVFELKMLQKTNKLFDEAIKHNILDI